MNQKTILLDMYGVILEESKGNFLPYTYGHFPESEYDRLTRLFRDEKLFTRAANGEMTSDAFLTRLGFDNPQFHMRDYIDHYLTLDPGFASALEAFLKEQDILLMVDEVQTGNGRTGSLYAYMQYGLHPDVVSTAKGLAGGLPMGATLLSEKLKDVFSFGDHGSTFGGNPVAAAAALSVVSRLTDEFLADVTRKGELLRGLLKNAPGIEALTGLGLMVGIRTARPAAEVVADCMAGGVLCLTAKDKVRLLPALNIPDELLIKAADVIKAACAK